MARLVWGSQPDSFMPAKEFTMKNLFLAAFAALSLTAAIVPAAQAATFGHSQYHSGPYDNTGRGPGETGLEGGGG